MKKSKFTEEQIAFVLRQVAASSFRWRWTDGRMNMA